jgi:sulfur carrier protein
VIVLNGEVSAVDPGATVSDVLARLGLQPEERGVAVAVDGEVVPRTDWGSFALGADARVEVLRAMQGG